MEEFELDSTDSTDGLENAFDLRLLVRNARPEHASFGWYSDFLMSGYKSTSVLLWRVKIPPSGLPTTFLLKKSFLDCLTLSGWPAYDALNKWTILIPFSSFRFNHRSKATLTYTSDWTGDIHNNEIILIILLPTCRHHKWLCSSLRLFKRYLCQFFQIKIRMLFFNKSDSFIQH